MKIKRYNWFCDLSFGWAFRVKHKIQWSQWLTAKCKRLLNLLHFQAEKYSEKRKRFSVARLALWTHYCFV